MTCPGCDGPLSRGATLCRGCRKRAIELGVRALLERRQAGHRPNGIAPRQLAAFHGKAGGVDKKLGRVIGDTKRLALEAAAAHFDITIASVKELSYEEASWTLDWLAEQERAAELADLDLLDIDR